MKLSACPLLAVFVTVTAGCGPWVVPFPQPMVDPTNLPAVPDGSARVGVGLNPLSAEGTSGVSPLPGDLLGGTVRLDGGVGFQGWDLRAVVSPMASRVNHGSQYDLRVGRRLYGGPHVRLDVTDGAGATWFASTYKDADYGYFAIAPHLGPRVSFKLGPRVEVPVVVEAGWSHVVPVYGLGAESRSAWWLGAAAAGVWHPGRGFSLGSGLDLVVSPDFPWTDLRLTFGASFEAPTKRRSVVEASHGGP